MRGAPRTAPLLLRGTESRVGKIRLPSPSKGKRSSIANDWQLEP